MLALPPAVSLQDISSLATAVAVLVGVGALFFTFRSVRIAGDAAKRAVGASVSQAYAAITQQMSYFNKLLLDNSSWIPYFYENTEPPENLEAQLELVCEAIMDFADAVIEQRGTAREVSPMDWSTWDAYFRFLYNASPVLRRYVPENLDYYPDYECAVLGYIIVRNPLTGEVVSTWHAREIDLTVGGDQHYAELFANPERDYVGLAGYPWVRTWVIEPADPELPRDPVLIAAVEIPEPQLARVHVRAQGEVSKDAAKTLHSWVLGTLATSTLIDHVHVHTGPVAGGPPPAKYDLRSALPAHQKAYEWYGLPRFKEL